MCQGRAVYRPTRIRGTGEGAGGGDDEGNLEKASGRNISSGRNVSSVAERCRVVHLALSEVNTF